MKTVLNVEGMSCEHCVKHITEALEGIAGVKSATVNLKHKKAEVNHGGEVTLDAMKAAVSEAGYEVVGNSSE
ncbi:MAG: cation transporter [Treponema sp.]|jgi:copper ion binding protein|nr:cation transporter [Treponema sp.]